ncbi:MAG: Fructose-1,6-bisphosphatase/inositol-1-monophosphatase [Chroococcopsis gigantea SAG 12.99]|jgi:myo-inositol-1(or 4)-monophosphatase|nr:inositol monophosphatase family protein [Chlorogloea purpurea SAG 13.99]MDV3002332.1 Fructose-1,6-bisphosphatase/inositol-1-monophosphatase [Chroococcopsis gigantea SAG 12.99]
MDFWSQILDFCHSSTKAVGEKLIVLSGKITATKKNDGTLVTEADRIADAQLRSLITSTFPNHGVLTEETTHIFPDKDWCWIIDPIDGTTNFSHGLPIWGISLGLVYRGTPVFGFVYIPNLSKSYYGYWSDRDDLNIPTGAYCNGESIHTSDALPDKNNLFNLCARSTKILAKPFPCKIRMIGVASYNILLVADGAALGGVEATPKIWDIAGVWPIIQAAGGCFISLGEENLFPLTVGENYRDKSYPCLVVARSELVPIFKPLVHSIGGN